VTAGETGSGSGMSVFKPSTSGNNKGLLEFKWEILISGWPCGVKIAEMGSDTAVLMSCYEVRQVTFIYIDLQTQSVIS
jgi:hypothetical protein